MELSLSPAAAPVLHAILTPAQHSAVETLRDLIACGNVVVLQGETGHGKTTILKRIHAETGGVYVGMQEFMRSLDAIDPFAIEEAWTRTVETGLAASDIVYLDDFHLVMNVAQHYNYSRANLLDLAVTSVLEQAADKKLVFAVTESIPDPLRQRAHVCKIAKFTPDDYRAIGSSYWNGSGASLDYVRLHRFAPALNAHQLKTACLRMSSINGLDTEAFLEYLSSQNLSSNVDIAEVEPVDWKDLKGMDDLIRALEAKIALPLENHELAAELQLKPKRGVLLAGPPGTGKTTIGRALAHRLRSKFFLIDGTVIASSNDFYCKLNEIFEAAKLNAPSIIFIDDADVLFEDGDHKPGLYRYLLTMLDGLEGASSERVCVMMTAMEVSSLPAALVRSGRVELWLQTRLPDETARESILAERVAGLPQPLAAVDTLTLARASRGLSGADLKAAVEDAKLLYAHERVQGHPTEPVGRYFMEAIAAIRANRRNYARRKPAEKLDAAKVGFCAAGS